MKRKRNTIIDNTDFKGGLFKKEAGFKSELSAHLSYVGLEAIFSLKPTYMFDKITYEAGTCFEKKESPKNIGMSDQYNFLFVTIANNKQ